jgi:prevent-host-death family protein
MQTVNIHAAKTQLSRLVDDAAAGQEIIIARAGKPVARLMPLASPPQRPPRRVLGILAGQLQVPADFDASLSEDDLASFEGR